MSQYQYRGLCLWIWDNTALVCVGIEGWGARPEAGRRRGVESLETRAEPSDTNRRDGPTLLGPTSVLIPGGPQPHPLLLPPDLGHEVGIGGGLGSQVLGLGDVEQDVHDVSGDVQGQSDLGAPVTLGLVLGWPPLEMCLGRVLVPGAASPATTAATPGAREGPFLCVLPSCPSWSSRSPRGRAGKVRLISSDVSFRWLFSASRRAVWRQPRLDPALEDLWERPASGAPRSSSKTSRKGAGTSISPCCGKEQHV